MSGFIYIWFDLKRKMFYVGSRWGNPEGSYVCSSNWMKRAYKRRPQTFKRRILSFHLYRAEMLAEEERLLKMISDSELGSKFYNLHRSTGHWHGKSDMALVVEKMKASWTPERKAKQSGPKPWSEKRLAAFRSKTIGKKRTPEMRANMSKGHEKRVKDAACKIKPQKIKQPRKAPKVKPFSTLDHSLNAKEMWAQMSVEKYESIKAKMSQASKGKGYIVSSDGAQTKRMLKEEMAPYLENGWILGRKLPENYSIGYLRKKSKNQTVKGAK